MKLKLYELKNSLKNIQKYVCKTEEKIWKINEWIQRFTQNYIVILPRIKAILDVQQTTIFFFK